MKKWFKQGVTWADLSRVWRMYLSYVEERREEKSKEVISVTLQRKSSFWMLSKKEKFKWDKPLTALLQNADRLSSPFSKTRARTLSNSNSSMNRTRFSSRIVDNFEFRRLRARVSENVKRTSVLHFVVSFSYYQVSSHTVRLGSNDYFEL